MRWVFPNPTPPYKYRGLYVLPGASATARAAACANRLHEATTKLPKVYFSLSGAEGISGSWGTAITSAPFSVLVFKSPGPLNSAVGLGPVRRCSPSGWGVAHSIRQLSSFNSLRDSPNALEY